MTDVYQVEWAPAAKRDSARLPGKVATVVVEFVYGGLAGNPQRVGHALRFELAGLHAARRGDFRVIYRIDTRSRRVLVMLIDHRSDVYRQR